MGSISFSQIPAGNGIRVPLFYAEMDNSQANTLNNQPQRALLIGQKLAAGSAPVNTPVIVASESQAISLFGAGSMLERMVEIYRQIDPLGELWCIPVADNGAGVAATGTITVTGPATAAGTINLYIAGQLVQVAVASGDAQNTIAAAINTAINAAAELPVTSTVATNVVTLTARWKGATGNDITVLDSFRGQAGGEALPSGVALTYVAMASGATNPTLTGAIIAMGDDAYDFVIHPYTDATSLAALALELGDVSGRWSYGRQVYGHAYSANRGTLANLVSFGGALNDQHHTIAAIDVDCPVPSWEYAAAYGAANAVGIKADPARPTQTLKLTGLLAPRAGKRFLMTERNSLLSYGIATSAVVNGTLQIERAITTYQKNAYAQADVSYLDSETMHTAAYVLRALRSAITSKFPRHKLDSDGTRYGAGNAVVTPKVIRSEILAVYKQLEDLGIVENTDIFAQYLIIERDAVNVNRVNVLFPPDYVNQLRVFAVLNQFRLQFAGA